MRAPSFAFAAFLLFPLPARADISFVQIVQGQTSKGRDGIFGKTWVELKGNKMRLVSGYARKVRKEEKDKDPRRLIQIIDLDAAERLLLFPESKSYARAPLAAIDYGNEMDKALYRGRRAWRIRAHDISLAKERHVRKIMDTDCAHYRIELRLELDGPQGRRARARMDQNVWVAPISGALSKNVLDLIAFENAYRAKSGGGLSPLDYERYQIREAAAYLRVPEEELRPIVETVRARFRELPSYPVASSVSWWRDDEEKTKNPGKGIALGDIKPAMPSEPGEPPKTGVPAAAKRIRVQAPLLRRSRLRFVAMDWRKDERDINRMYDRTKRQVGGFPLGTFRPPRATRIFPTARPERTYDEPAIYPRFEAELQKVLQLLIREQEEGLEPAPEPRTPNDPGPSAAPFYEIYTEIYGLEASSEVAVSDFSIPKGYRPSEKE